MRPQFAETRRTRIAVVDNHPVFREGLRQLLEREPDFIIVGTAEGGAQGVSLVLEKKPDILLLDASMPGMSGIETTRSLGKVARNTKIVLVTAGIDDSELVSFVQLGVRGIVLKHSTTQELCVAIRAVMAGYYWMFSEPASSFGEAVAYCFLTPRSSYRLETEFGLTSRELLIVSSVLGGRSNKDIAVDLSISEQTVKHHLTNIFKKVRVSSRLQLTLFVNSLKSR